MEQVLNTQRTYHTTTVPFPAAKKPATETTKQSVLLSIAQRFMPIIRQVKVALRQAANQHAHHTTGESRTTASRESRLENRKKPTNRRNIEKIVLTMSKLVQTQQSDLKII
jgi:hypothetical protein